MATSTGTNMETDNVDDPQWTEVKRKKDPKSGEAELLELTMKKVKVTITIRVPKDTTNFTPAKIHIDALHEIHKHDESMMVFNHAGDAKINIETALTEAKYKATFQPVEKRIGRGPVTISISHDICLTRKASTIKEEIFPFLKKNKVFIYFNPKPGLEHFSSIGVLFGPNPDFTWRDELAGLLIETMKTEISDDEKAILGTTNDGKPIIILSLNIQTVGSNAGTTSVALEIRVPSGKERLYTEIIERVYEKAENEEIIIPQQLGKFFPYYLRSKMPEVFQFLMRQQNAEMAKTTIIPIFGYTPEVRKQQITIEGESTTVELALATMNEIIRIEATPSTWNLYKYLVIVENKNKSTVQKQSSTFLQRSPDHWRTNQQTFQFLDVADARLHQKFKKTTKKKSTKQHRLTWSV